MGIAALALLAAAVVPYEYNKFQQTLQAVDDAQKASTEAAERVKSLTDVKLHYTTFLKDASYIEANLDVNLRRKMAFAALTDSVAQEKMLDFAQLIVKDSTAVVMAKYQTQDTGNNLQVITHGPGHPPIPVSAEFTAKARQEIEQRTNSKLADEGIPVQVQIEYANFRI